ncbi:hypothetical protein Salat_1833900 [Sesamum alatum]|uniref:PH domain-containing protein n=1 Tax=Sesamum alatum TaxID=300844 RepID=A0AAE1Y2M5_9LAMI|nr:hypothetical protein Salat_1833900 [Sesamum alatum]
MGGGQAMKRIPRIKFPDRRAKASGTTSQRQETSENNDLVRNFFSRSPSSTSVGGKASDQPKRTPVSQEEIDAIMLGGLISDQGVYEQSEAMGDGPRGIQVFPDHFAASTSAAGSRPSQTSCVTDLRPHGHRLARRKLKNAVSILHLLTLRGLFRESGENGQEKVVLSAAEVKSLRSELAALDERESHCKAQLEHVNEILRSARLSGYLLLRTRWAALPGEPPVDDAEVDDWLPRFVVLHGSCIYLYMMATDLSPQDSTRLSDVVEVGHLPCMTREDEETQYCFYILTRQGLRYECASPSKIQVDSWLAALRTDCQLISDSKDLNHPRNGPFLAGKKQTAVAFFTAYDLYINQITRRLFLFLITADPFLVLLPIQNQLLYQANMNQYRYYGATGTADSSHVCSLCSTFRIRACFKEHP